MQEWYRIKVLPYFLLLFLVITSVFAIKECKGTTETDDIPCYLLLPFNQSGLDCTDYAVKVYANNSKIYTQQLGQYSPFMCNATFNETGLGTYNGQYSTGDTFSITVIKGDNMIYLFYFVLAIAFGLFGLGLWKRDATSLMLSGLAFFLTGVYVAMEGFNNLDNLLTWIISGVLWGLGIYILIRTSLEITQESLG